MDSDDDGENPRLSSTGADFKVHLDNDQVYKVHCEECFGDATIVGR
jgi:hypothetical protein